MPKVTYNGLIVSIRGKLGNLIFRQLKDGTTIVSEAPKKKRKFNRAQKKVQQRLTESAGYGILAAKQYPIYAEIAATRDGWTAYNVAISDWYHAPVIHCIKRRKGYILVEATDDVLVTNVHVTILDEAGKVLEEGEATRSHGDLWKFASRVQDKTIIAEAYDLPKNITRFVLE